MKLQATDYMVILAISAMVMITIVTIIVRFHRIRLLRRLEKEAIDSRKSLLNLLRSVDRHKLYDPSTLQTLHALITEYKSLLREQEIHEREVSGETLSDMLVRDEKIGAIELKLLDVRESFYSLKYSLLRPNEKSSPFFQDALNRFFKATVEFFERKKKWSSFQIG